MREIKFRIWDKKNKRWFIQYPYAGSFFPIRGDGTLSHPSEDDDYILVQYTNLKDKNGKEIWEGDIVMEYPGFGCEWEEPRKGHIEYSGASFWLKLKGMAYILDDHDCTLEKISNIYENPELLTIKEA